MISAVNTLIEYPGNGDDYRIERILYLEPEHDLAVTIFIYHNKALPAWKRLSEIEKTVERGSAVIVEQDPFTGLLDDNHRSDIQKGYRDRVWAIVKKLVLNDDGTPNLAIFDMRARGPLINQVSLTAGVYKSTVYRLLRRYWQRGQMKNALLPDYLMSGAKGKQRQAKREKIGRKSLTEHKLGYRIGIPINDELRKIFRRAINYHYKRGRTLTDTFQEILDNDFVADYKWDGHAMLPILVPLEERPTFRQFEHYFYKQLENDVVNLQKKHHGESRYTLKYRPIPGDSTQMAMGPGQLFQMDSTVVDAYLVSSLDRARIVGRPILYVIIDVFSRLIVGFCLMLEGPSWNSARFALENMAADKVKFCKEFSIDIFDYDWPSRHFPIGIIGDRGESLGKNGDNIPDNLNIVLSNTPPYRPDWKAIVERRFRLIDDEVVKFLPSFVVKDHQRGDKDYRLEAALTLNELRAILIRLFLHYNRSFRIKNWRRDELVITDHIEPYPIDLWNWGIANRTAKLRTMDQDLVRMNLLPRGEAHVTERGIIFGGRQYNSPYADERNWLARARARGRWTIDAFYEQQTTNHIFIRSDEGKLVPCFLSPNENVSRGKDWYEIANDDELEKLKQPAIIATTQQSKAELNAYVKAITEPAKDEAKKAREGMTKTAQTENIRENRAAEVEIERRKEKPTIPDEPNVETKTKDEIPGYIPPEKHTELFDRIDEEEFKNARP